MIGQHVWHIYKVEICLGMFESGKTVKLSRWSHDEFDIVTLATSNHSGCDFSPWGSEAEGLLIVPGDIWTLNIAVVRYELVGATSKQIKNRCTFIDVFNFSPMNNRASASSATLSIGSAPDARLGLDSDRPFSTIDEPDVGYPSK